jgi:hypothetical protein
VGLAGGTAEPVGWTAAREAAEKGLEVEVAGVAGEATAAGVAEEVWVRENAEVLEAEMVGSLVGWEGQGVETAVAFPVVGGSDLEGAVRAGVGMVVAEGGRAEAEVVGSAREEEGSESAAAVAEKLAGVAEIREEAVALLGSAGARREAAAREAAGRALGLLEEAEATA